MSSESKHTPEPWRVGIPGTVVSDSSEGITIRGGTGEEAVNFFGGNLICESVSVINAARIVECVNAMKGISDPEAFVRRAIELANTCKEQAEEIYKLKTQNDNKYYLIQGLRATILYLTGMLRKLKNTENNKRTERETEQDSL